MVRGFSQPVGEVDPQGPVVAVHQPDYFGFHPFDDLLPGFVDELEPQFPQPCVQPLPLFVFHRNRGAHHAQFDRKGLDSQLGEQLPHDHPAAVAHHVANV